MKGCRQQTADRIRYLERGYIEVIFVGVKYEICQLLPQSSCRTPLQSDHLFFPLSCVCKLAGVQPLELALPSSHSWVPVYSTCLWPSLGRWLPEAHSHGERQKESKLNQASKFQTSACVRCGGTQCMSCLCVLLTDAFHGKVKGLGGILLPWT